MLYIFFSLIVCLFVVTRRQGSLAPNRDVADKSFCKNVHPRIVSTSSTVTVVFMNLLLHRRASLFVELKRCTSGPDASVLFHSHQ